MRTQPTVCISMARVYSLKVSMSSGARYHRVATYLVMKVWCVVCVPVPGPNEGAAVVDIGQGTGRASGTKVAELWDGKTRRRRAEDDTP